MNHDDATSPVPGKSMAELHRQAREIFDFALRESSIPTAFERHLRWENGRMLSLSRIDGLPPGSDSPGSYEPGSYEPGSYELDRYSAIYVVALGKAALPMLDALLNTIDPWLEKPGPPKLPLRGICCAPALPSRPRTGIEYYAGGHPSPNLDSRRAARAALALLRGAAPDALVVFLISGGGSSLFEAPLNDEISLEETIVFHQALVGCGAAIGEINTVRKHFSAVKGGRLAAAAGRADKLSLLISDVPEQQIGALSSGPSLPDRSTVAECRSILERHRLLDRFPPRVRNFFLDPELPETPRSLPGAAQFRVLLSNKDLIEAARSKAKAVGWVTEVDNGCDDWDYRDAARYLLKRFDRLRRQHPRVCLLSGGEVTVRLEGTPGAGGRNQQLALACALEWARESAQTRAGNPGPSVSSLPATTMPVAILSAGSDGVDGLSPAAGAIADPETAARASGVGIDAEAALRDFNAYPLFRALGDTVMTGPTGNNLRDLRILLSAENDFSSQ